MKFRYRHITVLFACLFTGLLHAAVAPYSFDDPDQEARYRELTEQLRCLVCQNQSLADSDAGLAQDLRQEVYQMVRDGKDAREVVDFMVTRYGDFVLYKPPLRPATWLLWAGPLLLLLVGLAVLAGWLRQRAATPVTPLTTEEAAHLRALLEEEAQRHDP